SSILETNSSITAGFDVADKSKITVSALSSSVMRIITDILLPKFECSLLARLLLPQIPCKGLVSKQYAYLLPPHIGTLALLLDLLEFVSQTRLQENHRLQLS